jgi:hypothetical protein
MPPVSTAKTFAKALQTRRTHTTEVLEQAFARNPSGPPHPQQGYLNDLQNATFNGPLPSWAKVALVQHSIDPGTELAHIDHWPGLQKDAVRELLIKAIQENRSVIFHWELHNGQDEDTDTMDEGEAPIVITFRSPQWKVRSAGPDSVIVDV